MKIEIPEFKPMAKCNEHLAHGPITIDLGEDVVEVIRCVNCAYYREQFKKGFRMTYCVGSPGRSAQEVFPSDYCSRGVKRKEEIKNG